jgi:hypothetical protein
MKVVKLILGTLFGLWALLSLAGLPNQIHTASQRGDTAASYLVGVVLGIAFIITISVLLFRSALRKGPPGGTTVIRRAHGARLDR